MLQDLFYCVLVFLLYRFIFSLVIPVTRAVKMMKKNVFKMPENQEPSTQTKTTEKPKPASKPSTTNLNEEYIDFEEIKN